MRALALFSGGLDSLLSVKLMEAQGIEVIALHILIGFGSKEDPRERLLKALEQTNAKLEIVDIRQDYIDNVLFSPKYGYGKNFNPCVDCHSKMINTAMSLLDKFQASFIVSGEVTGQRPMSQNKQAFEKIECLSKSSQLLLRPLSAKLLAPTLPQINGWVKEEFLFGISGRSRVEQKELAKKLGITKYQAAAGGCLLTDIGFSRRMKEFTKNDKGFQIEDIELMKHGRHFRLEDGAKLIVSRNQEENQLLEEVKPKNFTPTYIEDTLGPYCLLSNNASDKDIDLALKIVLTYHKTENKKYEIIYDKKYIFEDKFEDKKETHKYMI